MIDCAHASNRDLLDLQITTLFLLDSERRLLAINEPGTPLAPRFFLGRSTDGHRWRVRYDLPANVAQRLDQLCHAEPLRAPRAGPPPCNNASALRSTAHHGRITHRKRWPRNSVPCSMLRIGRSRSAAGKMHYTTDFLNRTFDAVLQNYRYAQTTPDRSG